MISPPPKDTPNDLQRLPNTGRKHGMTDYPRAITHTHTLTITSCPLAAALIMTNSDEEAGKSKEN